MTTPCPTSVLGHFYITICRPTPRCSAYKTPPYRWTLVRQRRADDISRTFGRARIRRAAQMLIGTARCVCEKVSRASGRCEQLYAAFATFPNCGSRGSRRARARKLARARVTQQLCTTRCPIRFFVHSTQHSVARAVSLITVSQVRVCVCGIARAFIQKAHMTYRMYSCRMLVILYAKTSVS